MINPYVQFLYSILASTLIDLSTKYIHTSEMVIWRSPDDIMLLEYKLSLVSSYEERVCYRAIRRSPDDTFL